MGQRMPNLKFAQKSSAVFKIFVFELAFLGDLSAYIETSKSNIFPEIDFPNFAAQSNKLGSSSSTIFCDYW